MLLALIRRSLAVALALSGCALSEFVAPTLAAAAVPVCTIIASSGTPLIGTTATLTAACTEAPTSFAWTNCTPVPGTATCTDAATAPGKKAYSLVPHNASGDGMMVNVVLDWKSALVSAPPECAISASPTMTPTVGMTVTLSASCTDSPTFHRWTNCATVTPDTSKCLATSTLAVIVPYWVSGYNSMGFGSSTPFTLQWKTATGNTPACTVTASSPAPTVTTPVTLTASCTNNPTSYQWTNCTSTTATCTTTFATPGYVTYAVVAVNGAGLGTPSTVNVLWQEAVAAKQPAVEYYHAGLDHYFVTANWDEVTKLDNGAFAGWKRTGQTWWVLTSTTPRNGAISPVCRFYGDPGAGLDSHFYSGLPAECADVKVHFPQWIWESGNVFEIYLPEAATGACPTGSQPLYRSWNNRADSNHRYTTSLAIQDQMTAKGYIPEGSGSPPVVMCVPL